MSCRRHSSALVFCGSTYEAKGFTWAFRTHPGIVDLIAGQIYMQVNDYAKAEHSLDKAIRENFTKAGKPPCFWARRSKERIRPDRTPVTFRLVAWMEGGANVNAENALGQRALGFFAEHENTAAVKSLVARRAEVEYADANGDSPLRLAVRRGRVETLRFLLDRGPAKHLDDLLFESALRGDLATTRLLIAAGGNVNFASAGRPPPLIGAIFSRDLPTIRLLLDSGVDASAVYQGRRIFEYAIDTGDPGIVDVLTNAKKSAV